MSNPVGPASANSAEWDDAWKSIRRLADAHQSVAGRAPASNGSNPVPIAAHSSSVVAIAPDDDILFISDQAQHDFREIESALAALRSAQPDLEAWPVLKEKAASARKPRSVWLVIGAVWISTVLLMAMATFAIASLLR